MIPFLSHVSNFVARVFISCPSRFLSLFHTSLRVLSLRFSFRGFLYKSGVYSSDVLRCIMLQDMPRPKSYKKSTPNSSARADLTKSDQKPVEAKSVFPTESETVSILGTELHLYIPIKPVLQVIAGYTRPWIARVEGIAGLVEYAGDVMGPCDKARFRSPRRIATSVVRSAADGKLRARVFVSDTGNALIKRIDVTESVVTLTSGNDEFVGHYPGLPESYDEPRALIIDWKQSVPEAGWYALWVGDRFSVRVVVDGVATPIAGRYIKSSRDPVPCIDHTHGLSATFHTVTGLALSRSGEQLYVCESGYNRIRMISTKHPNPVTTIAGSGKCETVDGIGRNCSINAPWGMVLYRGAVSEGEVLFITSQISRRGIRRLDVTTGMWLCLCLCPIHNRERVAIRCDVTLYDRPNDDPSTLKRTGGFLSGSD